MAVNSLSTLDALMKDWYTPRRVVDMSVRKSAFLAKLRKKAQAGGRRIVQPTIYAAAGGDSNTFSNALSNSTALGSVDFLITRKNVYQIADIERHLIVSARSEKEAFINVSRIVDSVIYNATDSIATQLFGASGGAIGQISSDTNVASTTITLADPGQIGNFKKGDVLKLDDVNGGGSAHSGTLTVDTVNRANGSFTTTVQVDSAIGSAAAGDYIFKDGNYDACIAGLESWLTTTAPSDGEFFYGVDRSEDSLLYGLYHDGTSQSIQEALIKTAAELQAYHNADPDVVFMNPLKLAELSQELGAKRDFALVDVKTGKASVGFRGFQIETGMSPVTVMADPHCPKNKAYMLTMDSWTLWCAGGAAPAIADDDTMLQRKTSTDDYQVRVAMYGNLGCEAPGHNAVIALSS